MRRPPGPIDPRWSAHSEPPSTLLPAEALTDAPSHTRRHTHGQDAPAPTNSAWWPLLAGVLIGLLCTAAVHANPAALADPTRPPSAVLAATATAHGPAGARPLAEPAAPPPPPALPVLQAVQLPARGAASALIDGRLVQVGDSVGDRLTVSAIDAQGVSLRGAGGPLRLRLLGEDNKQPAGSIVITRSTSFAPAAGPATGTTPAPGALPGAATPPGTGPAADPDTAASSTAPVAVAGRNRP